VLTDVSEEYIASIFKVEEISSAKNSASKQVARFLLATCLLAGFFAELIYSTLKMEAIYSSETSANTQRTTWHHIPEDDTFHN
jgi:hypothetical protein